MMRICWFSVVALSVLLSVTSCGTDDGGPAAPDVSAIAVDLGARRFDQDLRAASLDSTVDGAGVLRQAYPVFFDSVWLRLMLPGDFEAYDSALVHAFSREPPLRRLIDSVTVAFPPEEADPPWERDLTQAFRYAKHYFPDAPTPELVTYVSELSLGNLTYGDELLGVGLDFYLGAGFAGYSTEVFPQYVQRSMNRDHIASRAVEAWLSNRLGPARGQRMLDQMVHNGKLLYLKTLLLPHVPDTATLVFAKAELAWLRANEAQMWTHYTDENLLYETSGKRIGKHVGVSPNVPGMPAEAPGGGANWVGMQIVRAWVKRNPEKTLADLIGERDAQKLLTESKYRPGF